ncbi:MAG: DUF4177 domain-containing protein [Nitrospirae bacterium]|nr:DUF4177 domain-containing protein [Fimbriimonadaceae bacterium]
MYEYHTVQIPPNIGVRMGRAEGAAAAYLKDVIDRHAKDGWEFYSVERIGIVESRGCGCMSLLLTLTGGSTKQHSDVYVVVFRRLLE